MTTSRSIAGSSILTSMLLLSLASQAAEPAYRVNMVTRWETAVEHAGKCSPRAADLNADGVDDVIVGSGFEHHWGDVVALDGKTGRTLWRRRLPDEVLTAIPFVDADGDGILDVFVGGRMGIRDVFALSGVDGHTLWQLTVANPDAEFLPTNYINLLRLDDRDEDGLPDLLVVQSGGMDAVRPAARFYVVGSANGRLLATHIAPDGKESYSIPLYQERAAGSDRLYVGTGGETISGNLIKLSYPSMKEMWRIRAIGGGFVGSPRLADLESDGVDEVVATGMNGAVYVVDADTGELRWRWRERPLWTYVSPAVGSFDDDSTLDVVAGFNRGRWPRRDRSRLLWLDGRSGRVISEKTFDERSRFTASSPLVLDVNRDGLDETLIVLSDPVPDPSVPDETHRLVLFDGGVEREELLSVELRGYSVSTPRLADLDGNGLLDVIHASHHGVMRLELVVVGPDPPGGSTALPQVRWGELRGPNGSGID